MKVYIFTEYNDDYPLGEMITEAYASKEDAEKRLRERFEDWFEGITPEDYKEQLIAKGDPDGDADYIEKDHISIHDGFDAMLYWNVERLEVL